MRRPAFRVAVVPLALMALVAGIALAIVRPRVPLLRVGAACALEPQDEGFRRFDTLRRVALVDDGTAWAVGSRYSGSVGQPVAFLWRDGGWRKTEVPTASTTATSGLHDVASLGEDAAWAVGSLRARLPIAVAWDGRIWTDVPTEGLAEDATAEWLGVAASRAVGVLAVGKVLDGLAYRTIVGRLDGDRFLAEFGPNVGEGNNVLHDVDARRETAWAVGWTVEGGVYRTLAARYSAGAWIVEPTPDPGVGDDVLSAVAVVDADTAWAVGWSRDAEGESQPLLIRWDGEVWRQEPLPVTQGRLLTVAAIGERVAVGGDVIDEERRPVALGLVLVDGAWEAIAAPDPVDRWYTGLALFGEEGAVAVGSQVVSGRYGSFVATGC